MAIARVQAGGSGATTGAVATIAATLSSVGVGNGLIVLIGADVPSATTVSGVSDTHNTYTHASGIALSTSAVMGDLWYCKQTTTGGSLTITVTFSQACGGLLTVIEVSGQDTVSFFDVGKSANATSTAPNSGATAATTAANEFCVGYVQSNSTAATATGPTFSTALTSITTETTPANSTTADKGDLSTFDGILVSSGVAETFSATIAASHPWVAVCATFKPAAAAATTAAPPPITRRLQAVGRAASWCKGERLWVPNRRIFVPQMAMAA